MTFHVFVTSLIKPKNFYVLYQKQTYVQNLNRPQLG